jgi:hypothetical protein
MVKVGFVGDGMMKIANGKMTQAYDLLARSFQMVEGRVKQHELVIIRIL